MATVVNDRDVLLLAASPRLLWTGVRGVTVAADATIFKVNSGVPTPSSINLSATLNGVYGTVVWSVTFGTATLTPSGASCVLSYSNMVSEVVTVKATVTENGIDWSGSITLSKVTNGATGATGSTGAAGVSGDKSRIAYTLVDGFSLASSPSAVSVTGDTTPATGTWGETRAWAGTPSATAVGQSVFQTTGTYNPTTNQTTWVVPYLSNLKVGNLAALTVNTGALTVDSSGHIKGGQSSYNSGAGFWLGNDSGAYKFSIGNSNTNFTYDGSVLRLKANNGDCVIGDSSLQPTFSFSRTTSTTLPSILITDASSATSQMLVVQSGSSFAGAQMVAFTTQKGESLRSVTYDSSQFCSVFQNLGGSTTALAIAGTTYSGYAGSGDGQMNITDGYLPFTGIHISFFDRSSEYEIGDIVYSHKVLLKADISNTILEVRVTETENKKSVFGVINKECLYENYLDFDMQTWYNYQELYIGLNINSVGEGCINVCGMNGDIEAGDLITSSNIRGKGMKQSDDVVRSYTVAKSTEDVKFDFPEQVKMIACTYMCG